MDRDDLAPTSHLVNVTCNSPDDRRAQVTVASACACNVMHQI